MDSRERLLRSSYLSGNSRIRSLNSFFFFFLSGQYVIDSLTVGAAAVPAQIRKPEGGALKDGVRHCRVP